MQMAMKGSPDYIRLIPWIREALIDNLSGEIPKGTPHISVSACWILSILLGIHRCLSPWSGWSMDVRDRDPQPLVW
eukprot:12880286-Ditylum_brightwellii.AAC.1